MSLDAHNHITGIALRSIAIARELQHEMVTLEHLLAALLERPDVQRCCKDLSIDHAPLQQEINQFLQGNTHEQVPAVPMRTREFDTVIGRAIGYAQITKRSPDGIDVLVQLAQMPQEDSHAVILLLRSGIDGLKLKRYLSHGVARVPTRPEDGDAEPNDRNEALAYIKKYCVDLNELAEQGKIDPCIGRLSELGRIMQIISRRTKNNVALVGSAGVGKTSVVEGLAFNIVAGTVPKVLRGSTIWALDVGSLVAGTRLRGDFEERMKFLLKAFSVIEDEDPILFIDEIHTIMEAGSVHKGALDVSNLLKPALAKGKLRCIGSTTDKDWRQYFEKDRALLRRFKKLLIDEPSVDDAKLILRGLRGVYEAFHCVSYTDAALDAAVDLTYRYVHDGHLPDKALDVIDEAGARQRITDENRQTVIDVADIEAEVACVVQIPAQSIREQEAGQLHNLETDLGAAVFGQSSAIRTLTDAVLISRAGLRDCNKPAGCFLFIGLTGCGKTELARQLAKTLGVPLIKFDMSEYVERHSVAKLIGAPPGYVGFGEGGAGDGLLINAVDKSSSCVLLLDEIEKAHLDIFNILLQVMDDAILTNSAGKTVNFRNVFLIMTSNLGVASAERHGIGFVPTETAMIDEQEVVKTFSPEFRNRLDAMVKFNALDSDTILRIVQKFINQLMEMVADRAITIEVTDAAKLWLAEHGADPVMGARPLGRLIDKTIKRPLSRLLLFDPVAKGGTVEIIVDNDELLVTRR